jgi:phosphoglucosamine mutase
VKAFGTDGIRGRANVDVTPGLAMALGNALVRVLGPRIAVARDTRPSGPMLVAAATAGICAAGGEAVDLGVLPTPGLSALVAALGLDGGVMVTASHNPAPDNGLKAVDGEGRKLGDAPRARIEALLDGDLHLADEPGGVRTVADAGDRYVAAVLAALPPGRWLAGATIVVDAAHGAGAGYAARIVSALGARVIPLGDGGGAINTGGAMFPEALVAAVRGAGAAAGIALDGDGDRGVLVTAAGEVLDGDALLWLCADGAAVVGTIMTNGGVESGLAARGIRLVRTPVGDAYVAAALRETGAGVGAEPSGHVLFSDGLPTADGLLAALRALHPDPGTLAARIAGLPRHAQLQVAVKVPGERIAAVEADIAAVRATGARVVVRRSGTEPVVRIMVEHVDPDLARAGLDRLRAALELP